MSRLRPAAVAAATVSLALALTACGGDTTSAGASGSSGGEGATITYGIYEPGADSGYLLMGKEKDFFAKHGVKVNVVQMKSGQQAFPALLAKQVDIIQGRAGGPGGRRHLSPEGHREHRRGPVPLLRRRRMSSSNAA